MPALACRFHNANDDIIEGIVVMRKGENPSEVLKGIRSKIDEMNNGILPKDVHIDTFYDRDNLVEYCTETVMHNLLEGIIFVTMVVFLFMC